MKLYVLIKLLLIVSAIYLYGYGMYRLGNRNLIRRIQKDLKNGKFPKVFKSDFGLKKLRSPQELNLYEPNPEVYTQSWEEANKEKARDYKL